MFSKLLPLFELLMHYDKVKVFIYSARDTLYIV